MTDKVPCRHCNRSYSKSGLPSHERHCDKNPEKGKEAAAPQAAAGAPQHEEEDFSVADEIEQLLWDNGIQRGRKSISKVLLSTDNIDDLDDPQYWDDILKDFSVQSHKRKMILRARGFTTEEIAGVGEKNEEQRFSSRVAEEEDDEEIEELLKRSQKSIKRSLLELDMAERELQLEERRAKLESLRNPRESKKDEEEKRLYTLASGEAVRLTDKEIAEYELKMAQLKSKKPAAEEEMVEFPWPTPDGGTIPLKVDRSSLPIYMIMSQSNSNSGKEELKILKDEMSHREERDRQMVDELKSENAALREGVLLNKLEELTHIAASKGNEIERAISTVEQLKQKGYYDAGDVNSKSLDIQRDTVQGLFGLINEQQRAANQTKQEFMKLATSIMEENMKKKMNEGAPPQNEMQFSEAELMEIERALRAEEERRKPPLKTPSRKKQEEPKEDEDDDGKEEY